jgi:LL-diaminopimelate aminotransferase
VGFVAGNAEVVGALADLKSNLDSGVFNAVQEAGIAAMRLWPRHLPELLATYQRRRDVLVNGLREIGYQPPMPRATFYVWMPVPGGDEKQFASRLIEEAGVLVTPGSGFGPSGAGYIRLTLCQEEDRLTEAVERIKRVGIGKQE